MSNIETLVLLVISLTIVITIIVTLIDDEGMVQILQVFDRCLVFELSLHHLYPKSYFVAPLSRICLLDKRVEQEQESLSCYLATQRVMNKSSRQRGLDLLFTTLFKWGILCKQQSLSFTTNHLKVKRKRMQVIESLILCIL